MFSFIFLNDRGWISGVRHNDLSTSLSRTEKRLAIVNELPIIGRITAAFQAILELMEGIRDVLNLSRRSDKKSFSFKKLTFSVLSALPFGCLVAAWHNKHSNESDSTTSTSDKLGIRLGIKNPKFHGTTFCTLFVMSKLSGPNKHSLIPFGELMEQGIPCFVGEVERGVDGVNRRGTSWTSSASVAASYATGHFQGYGGRHTIEHSRERLNALIEEYIALQNKKYNAMGELFLKNFR